MTFQKKNEEKQSEFFVQPQIRAEHGTLKTGLKPRGFRPVSEIIDMI